MDEYIDTTSIASKTNICKYVWNENPTSEWKFSFPEYSGINVNMIPFKFFNSKNTLPEYLHGYLNMIRSCPIDFNSYDSNGDTVASNMDKICYLTVHESIVKKGETQRRPGIHIEQSKPGGRFVEEQLSRNGNEYKSLRWGLGTINSDGFPIDGIYMATNIANSCKIYDVLINNPENIIDKYGGLDYVLSNKIKKYGYCCEPNQLYWITDRTPHESAPVEENCKRQFFRLVAGKIDVWHSQHNTPNPMVESDATIIHESKF